MRLGLMNNPTRPVLDEVRRIAAQGFAFVDLTLEPPGAWPLDADALRRELDALGLGVVGHTAYYLPIASPFPLVREAALTTIERQLDVFAGLGARLVNLHPDGSVRLDDRADVRRRNVEALARLDASAAPLGLRMMVENLGRGFRDADELGPLLDAVPRAGLHLDVGHANIGSGGGTRRLLGLLERYGDRLLHVHLHDNNGMADQHLPLGAGTVDWPTVAGALAGRAPEAATLEVFSSAEAHVETSRRLWLEWLATAEEEAAAQASPS